MSTGSSFALDSGKHLRLGLENIAQVLQILSCHPFSSEEPHIHLDDTGEGIFRLFERFTDQVCHAPRSLVRDLQVTLDCLCRKTALRVREHHEYVEPHCQRYSRFLKNSSCCRGDLERTSAALEFWSVPHQSKLATAGTS